MASTVTKTGPYFNGTNSPSNTTNMKFSQLRDTFRLNNPAGAISADELRRHTSTSITDPILPDCTENSHVAEVNNWKVSQMQGTIKYYDMDNPSSDDNTNWDINTEPWNNNLEKNIKKKLFLRGDHTSTLTSTPAARINSAAWNLTIEVHGTVKGAGGAGGTSGSVSGKVGGHALQFNGGSILVDIKSTGRIWAGGGGGEFGGPGSAPVQGTCHKDQTVKTCGGTPSQSTCNNTYPGSTLTNTWGGGCCNKIRYCGGPWESFCWHECWADWTHGNCRSTTATTGGSAGTGGNGGHGRGWNYATGSLGGSSGASGGCPSCAGGWDYQNDGSCGGVGQTGGSGGSWGQNGGNTNASGSGGAAGDAINGTGHTVVGDNSTTVKGSI